MASAGAQSRRRGGVEVRAPRGCPKQAAAPVAPAPRAAVAAVVPARMAPLLVARFLRWRPAGPVTCDGVVRKVEGAVRRALRTNAVGRAAPRRARPLLG